MYSPSWRKCASPFRRELSRVSQRRLIVWLLMVISVASGCNTNQVDNANSGGAPNKQNVNANANSPSGGSQFANIGIKEPDRYSLTLTITAQEAADTPAKMPTLQFNLTRLDADRRWAFAFPAPPGQVVYLEKSGLRYLIFSDRKQYLEVAADEFGFSPARLLNPTAVADQFVSQAQLEKLGVEPVNGRTAMKHRFLAADQSRGKTDGMIYVDLETGLPVRSEVNLTLGETNLRMIVEARDLQLNPDRAQFDVPVGMKKITSQEGKLQIESFKSAVRYFIDIIRGSKPSLPVSANQPAANKNGSRAR